MQSKDSDISKRKLEIARVLARNGYEWLWSKWEIGKIFGNYKEHLGANSAASRTQPEILRQTLEELGTTFIKIGQMLSTRQDLLPQEYIDELCKLQDQASKVPYDDIDSAIRREFGGGPMTAFLSFTQEPRAAASIAQVHDAVLQDGTFVVVKVRRPGIEVQVEQDLAILGQAARFVSHNTEFGKRFDLEALADEFSSSLRNELDFVREGQNAERIAKDFTDDPSLHVPEIFWDFSTNSVLTMEAIQGIKIDDHASLDAAGIDRRELAKRCAHIAIEQTLDHGFFHADPHPGNFFVLPDGVVALIDYGMVGRLGERLRESLVRLSLGVSQHDTDRIIDELLTLGAAQGPTDRKSLGIDIDHLLQRYEGVSLGDISAARAFRDIMTTAHSHGLVLPTDLILLARVFAMDEGLGKSLDPDFKMMDFAQPYFKRFWLRSHSLKGMADRFREGVIDLADIGGEIPARLMRLAGTVERGELKVVSQIEVPDALAKQMQLAANRIAVSILTAGLIIGLGVLTLVFRPSGSEGIGPFVFQSLLVLGVACGAWLLLAFWKSSK